MSSTSNVYYSGSEVFSKIVRQPACMNSSCTSVAQAEVDTRAYVQRRRFAKSVAAATRLFFMQDVRSALMAHGDHQRFSTYWTQDLLRAARSEISLRLHKAHVDAEREKQLVWKLDRV